MALVMLVLMMSSMSVRGASSIAQGFLTDDSNVVSGAIASLKAGTANTVELATVENVDSMLGVAGTDSLIELSGGQGKVQIVTSGQTAVLVSDIAGTIKVGDKITASPIAGVGMKAMTSTVVIGTAQANLSSVKTESREVVSRSGKKQTVHIAAIPVQVDKVFYAAPDDTNSFLPPVLQSFAASLAGHQVSAVRVTLAGILVLLLFVVVTVLLYSAVRSSIISIGRNPLSESAVQKSLLQVGLTIVGILLFTVIVIYLILAA
jgi:hypothetical protein